MRNMADQILAAVYAMDCYGIDAGKTNLQKVIYLSLPSIEKRTYFRAYHYGPFSADVQTVMASLIKRGTLRYEERRLRLMHDLAPETGSDESRRRLHVTAEFLSEHGFTDTDTVSSLAKVDLLSRSKRKDARSDPVGFVKQQAKVLGWNELSRKKRTVITRFMEASRALEMRLSAGTT